MRCWCLLVEHTQQWFRNLCEDCNLITLVHIPWYSLWNNTLSGAQVIQTLQRLLMTSVWVLARVLASVRKEVKIKVKHAKTGGIKVMGVPSWQKLNLGSLILHRLPLVGQACVRSQTCCKACCRHVEPSAIGRKPPLVLHLLTGVWKLPGGGGGGGWNGDAGGVRCRRVGRWLFQTWERVGLLPHPNPSSKPDRATWICASDWAGADPRRSILCWGLTLGKGTDVSLGDLQLSPWPCGIQQWPLFSIRLNFIGYTWNSTMPRNLLRLNSSPTYK